jgi:hypothetical protein
VQADGPTHILLIFAQPFLTTNASGFTQKACNAYAGPGGLANKYKAQSIAKAKNICVLCIRSSQN